MQLRQGWNSLQRAAWQWNAESKPHPSTQPPRTLTHRPTHRYAQLIADADRKGADYVKSAAACAANFRQECARLGISGAAVRTELLQLGHQVPALFQEILGELRGEGLGEAVAYYRHFTAYAHSGADQQQQQQEPGGSTLPDVLPTLTEVREGRTAPPATKRGADAAAGGAAASSIEIDWDAALGGGGGTAAAAGAVGDGGGDIDWDLDLSDLTAAAEAISVDETGAAAGCDEAAAAAAEGGGASISWDIELTEAAAEDAAVVTAAGSTTSATAPDAVASTTTDATSTSSNSVEAAALRLEADHEYRAALMDDLQELRAFLLQRSAELGGGGGSSAELLNALLPPAVAAVDARAARRLLVAVEGALGSLNAPALRQLLLITGSRNYLDRLARELSRKAGQEAKMLAAAREVESRRQESRAALAALAPRSALLAERTRTAQRAVEAALSSQLGRRVHILGEINNALAAAAAAAKQQ